MTTPSHNTNASSKSPRWSSQQIRESRCALLVPLLTKRGFTLVERHCGNFELTAYPGLIIKESYWRWPERNLAGNAIDFFTKVLEMSFANAMEEITKGSIKDTGANKEEHASSS